MCTHVNTCLYVSIYAYMYIWIYSRSMWGENTTGDKDSTARAKAICANSSACLGEAPASFLSRCVHICICVFVYKYTYMCVCVHIPICCVRVVSQPLYIHRNMRVCMYIQLWVCVWTYKCMTWGFRVQQSYDTHRRRTLNRLSDSEKGERQKSARQRRVNGARGWQQEQEREGAPQQESEKEEQVHEKKHLRHCVCVCTHLAERNGTLHFGQQSERRILASITTKHNKISPF